MATIGQEEGSARLFNPACTSSRPEWASNSIQRVKRPGFEDRLVSDHRRFSSLLPFLAAKMGGRWRERKKLSRPSAASFGCRVKEVENWCLLCRGRHGHGRTSQREQVGRDKREGVGGSDENIASATQGQNEKEGRGGEGRSPANQRGRCARDLLEGGNAIVRRARQRLEMGPSRLPWEEDQHEGRVACVCFVVAL